METELRHFARLEDEYSFNCIFYLNKHDVFFCFFFLRLVILNARNRVESINKIAKSTSFA